MSKPILPLRVTEDGFAILRVHYGVIPDYDFEGASKGLSPEQIEQELEINWHASANKRVFPEFTEAHIAKRTIRCDPRGKFVCGWDFGGTPAWVLTQINKLGQWCVLDSLTGPENVNTELYAFATQVADRIYRRVCEPHGLQLQDLALEHFGDPAGNARPPSTRATKNDVVELRSAYSILRDGLQMIVGFDADGKPETIDKPGWGWNIRPGAVAIGERHAAVKARLTTFLNGYPLLLVDPDCQDLIDGFLGQYCYAQREDGRYELDPDKNWWSHVQDALQYPATRLFAAAPPRDEEDAGYQPGFASHGHRSPR